MNQLKLEFILENERLPRELDSLIVSFLKASMENYSKDLFERLYSKSHSVMKSYTMSYYLPGASFKADCIQLGQNKFTLYFSDCNKMSLFHFMNAFMQMKGKKYPMKGNSMTLTTLVTQPRRAVTDSEVIVKMSSSLIARRHDSETNKDTYYTYDQEEFGNVVKENVTLFLERMNLSVSARDFEIEAVKGKKIVADVFRNKVDANIGIYRLKGSTDLLNILYQAGVGSRRSEGHGKFELLL